MTSIADLATLASPADDDLLPIYDLSAETDKKITRAALLGATGTWTPVLIGDSTAGTQTYHTQVGRYVRIGSLVVARFYLRLVTIGSPVGATLISGLPFNSQNNASDFSAGAISYWAALGTAYVTLGAYVVPNTAYAILRGATAAAVGVSAVPVSAWTVNTELMGVLLYEA